MTQASFDVPGGPDLPEDALDNEALAKRVLEWAATIDQGSVIALQGSWGRGKTDVLARVARQTQSWRKTPSGVATRSLWINPWQYGTPDLLTPLVLLLLGRGITRGQSNEWINNPSLKRAAKTVIQAGVNYGLKAASLALPAGQLLDLAARPIDSILQELFAAPSAGNSELNFDSDPVTSMATAFRELVDEVLRLAVDVDSEHGRIVVCVDDLDRCLPHRQVAFLEAISFLASAGAKAVFVVALDPTLARQAVETHYGGGPFDADRYLDKMFTLRVNLRSLTRKDVAAVLEGELQRHAGTDGIRVLRGDQGQTELAVDGAAELIARYPSLSNGRVIRRVVSKLAMLHGSLASVFDGVSNEDARGRRWASFVLWMTAVERWPELRVALRAADRSYEALHPMAFRFGSKSVRSAVIETSKRLGPIPEVERLPTPESAPELVQLFRQYPDGLALWYSWDDMLTASGL